MLDLRLTIGDNSPPPAEILLPPRDERVAFEWPCVRGEVSVSQLCCIIVVYLVDEVPDLELRFFSSVLPSPFTVSTQIFPVTSGAKSFSGGGHGADRAWRVVLLCISSWVNSRDRQLSSSGEAA